LDVTLGAAVFRSILLAATLDLVFRASFYANYWVFLLRRFLHWKLKKRMRR
jgi:hypothetical protein